jgi:hypothetical protein
MQGMQQVTFFVSNIIFDHSFWALTYKLTNSLTTFKNTLRGKSFFNQCCLLLSGLGQGSLAPSLSTNITG